MKLSRCLTVTALVAVLAACTGILLTGCASTGDKKDAGPEMEAPQRIDEQGAALKGPSGSGPASRKEPVANTVANKVGNPGGSGEQPQSQQAGLKSDKQSFRHYVANLKQGLQRIFPGKVLDADWNRIGTILGGLFAMSLIYGLAFTLARLPLRRRGAGRRGGGQTGEHARGGVPQ